MATGPMTRLELEANERVKLLHARHEIERLLRDHNLIGSVNIAGQHGQLEALMHLDASWCRLKLESMPEGHAIRLRSLKADYAGDTEAQRVDLESSVGAARGFGAIMAVAGLAWLQAAEEFDKATGAEHTPLEPAHRKQ